MVQVPVQNRYNHQIGDYIGRAGIYTKPGVVTDKTEDGTITVDTSSEAIQKYHRHSNTTGLTLEEKERFNNIMDEVTKEESPVDRINVLQKHLDEIRKDTNNKKLGDFLTNEQTMLIRFAGQLPRIYQFDGSKIK